MAANRPAPVDCDPEEVIVMSTGVIGVDLDLAQGHERNHRAADAALGRDGHMRHAPS